MFPENWHFECCIVCELVSYQASTWYYLIFQKHFKLIFKSVFNEVFTFVSLQTKTFRVFWSAAQEIPCHNGCRKGVGWPWLLPRFGNFSKKTVVFLFSSRKNQISPGLTPKKFCKNPPVSPPWKNPSDAHACHLSIYATSRTTPRKSE